MRKEREWKVVHTSGKFIGFFGSPESARRLINKKFNGSPAFLIIERKNK